MITNFTKKQLPQVIFLRGLAALMVCLFHLYCGNPNLFMQGGIAKAFFNYGYLGVPIFFMISGFIICYSLPPHYQTRQFKTFFFKRITRIEPPYIVSILLVIGLNYLAGFVTHIPLRFSWLNFLFHFAYLNNFGIGEYYNVVYWTLGIEFQFYLLIGLLFKYISQSKTSVALTMLLILPLSFIHVTNMDLIFPNLPIFGLGMATYFYVFKKQMDKPVWLLCCALFLLQLYFFTPFPNFCAAAFALVALNSWKIRNKLIDFFSNISFSLYLTHTIIGGKVINLGLRYVASTMQRHALFLLALIISVGFAWLFYRVVERPFIALAKRITYRVHQ